MTHSPETGASLLFFKEMSMSRLARYHALILSWAALSPRPWIHLICLDPVLLRIYPQTSLSSASGDLKPLSKLTQMDLQQVLVNQWPFSSMTCALWEFSTESRNYWNFRQKWVLSSLVLFFSEMSDCIVLSCHIMKSRNPHIFLTSDEF